MKNAIVNLYSFEELSEETQQAILHEFCEFYEHGTTHKEICNDFAANKQLFFEDGSLVPEFLQERTP